MFVSISENDTNLKHLSNKNTARNKIEDGR